MSKVISLQQWKIEKQYKEYYANPISLKYDTIYPSSEIEKQRAKREQYRKMKNATKLINRIG